ncbi:MAG: HAD family phosphatase [Terrimesophilobacter sp.]
MSRHIPAAVLLDMDGTLVDTEPYWMTAENELVRSFGGEWSAEDGLGLVGSGLAVSAAIMQSRGVALSIDGIIAHLTQRVLDQAMGEIPWRPGALDLVRSVRDERIPTALVTMSMRPLAEHIAYAFEIPLFDIIVSGEDVGHPKPHPEPYLRAAELLGVDIKTCIAIEDSIPGLASAVASGAAAVGVPAHVPLPKSESYTLWTSLAGRTVDDLRDITLEHAGRNADSEAVT